MNIFIETYGCSYNFADSEYMKFMLNGKISLLDDADIIIVNTCAVKNKTILNLKKRIDEILKLNPKAKLIITGCLPQASKKAGIFEIPEMTNYSLLGTHSLNQIQYVVDSSEIEQILEEVQLQGKEEERLNITSSETIEIIPISKGCLSNCTFCQTKLARGHLESFSPEKIINRVSKAVNNGTKIIYLTSQDDGCYGFDFKDKNYNLVNLLEDLCKIEGDFKIRIGMANPVHIKKIIEPLMKVIKDPKIFKFLHIPIQSGSNRVLNDMRRGNSVEEFEKIIEVARKEIPKITIATDIIVGFPTETYEDFHETLELLKRQKIDVVNRSKYSARPGTLAADMKQISTNDITNRSRELTNAVRKISREKNEDWKAWKGEVIVEANKQKGSCVTRNEYYKPIVIAEEIKSGEYVNIKISNVGTFHLTGEKKEKTTSQ